jgi:hypothetical protein
VEQQQWDRMNRSKLGEFIAKIWLPGSSVQSKYSEQARFGWLFCLSLLEAKQGGRIGV